MRRDNNLFAGRKRKFKVATEREHNYPLACNTLNQNFTVFRKNLVRISNITSMETIPGWVCLSVIITYINMGLGWLYLTIAMDLADGKVIGWSLDTVMKAENTAVAKMKMRVINRTEHLPQKGSKPTRSRMHSKLF